MISAELFLFFSLHIETLTCCLTPRPVCNSHRAHFHSCCSAFDQLGAVAAQMPAVEQLFTLTACVGGADGSRPAVAQSLQYVRGQVEGALTDFTTWKTQLLCLGTQSGGECTELLRYLSISE